MSKARESFAALDDPILRLIAKCKSMPRGPKRSKLELKLGEMLKKQDAFIREEKYDSTEEPRCPT